MPSAQVVTLKSGQQNASSVDSKSPMHSFELRTSATLRRCSRFTSCPYVIRQGKVCRPHVPRSRRGTVVIARAMLWSLAVSYSLQLPSFLMTTAEEFAS